MAAYLSYRFMYLLYALKPKAGGGTETGHDSEIPTRGKCNTGKASAAEKRTMTLHARVAESVDAADLESAGMIRTGSNPVPSTI